MHLIEVVMSIMMMMMMMMMARITVRNEDLCLIWKMKQIILASEVVVAVVAPLTGGVSLDLSGRFDCCVLTRQWW